MIRKIVTLLIIISCTGCVPFNQKPSTTLSPPAEAELKKYYDDNLVEIMCLAEFLSPQRTLIGASYKRTDEGLKIDYITENSPAELAGLRVGDMFIRINGIPVESPFSIKSPSKVEIKRGHDIFAVNIVPVLMRSNNSIETLISIEELKDRKYIVETIITGVELNTVQFKTIYERSKWIISNWATVFWKLNFACLEGKVKSDNIAIKYRYSHRNFVTEQYQKGQDEFLDIYSNGSDIINFVKGDISVQELLDRSMIFINGSREKLLMQ